MTKPVAIYARVSTGDQHPDAQLGPLREYAARRGVDVREFIDHGVSGRRSSRSALDAMLAAARRREVAAVVVVRLDRLARSLAHMARLGEDLQALDVELVSLTEGIDTSTPTGRALFGMCGVFAQLEADLIRERTLAGVAAARRRGRRPGRPKAERDPAMVARLGRLRASGQSLASVARMLGLTKALVAKMERESRAG
jgi:DNA invertase Pin-like site-specific DNA recombinase